MEFITVEQFKEQAKEVQEIFLEWWNQYISDYDLVQDENRIMLYKNYLERGYIENDSYPLFTEGQLRKFIEDKTDGVVKNVQWHIEDDGVSKRGYSIYLLIKNEYRVTHHYIDLGEDLLQAYWKVACMIAKDQGENIYFIRKKYGRK